MRRPAVIVALLAVLASAPPAQSDDTIVADVPSVAQAQYTREADVAPIITADGSIVLVVQSTATTLDVVRLAPGSQDPQVLETLPAQAGTAPHFGGPSVSLRLLAAGQGFFLGRVDRSATSQALRHTLEWFASPSGPGAVIGSCEGDCGHCPAALRPLAADATDALIARDCTSGARVRAVIRHLSTGEEQPYTPPWRPATNDDFGGTLGAIAGRFAAGAGVMDWTTGQVFHQLAYVSPLLLDDGTLVYQRYPGPRTLRLGPDETRPTDIPITGNLVRVANGVILTSVNQVSGDVYSAWTPDGTLLGTLDPKMYLNGFAFDGTRLVYGIHLCMLMRVEQWRVGGPVPTPPTGHCDQAAPAGPVVVGPRTARVPLSCPADAHLGCVGQIQAFSPFRRLRAYGLRAGEQQDVTLASGLGPKSCRKLTATSPWSVVVLTDSVAVSQGGGGTKYPVERVDACGRKRRA